MANDIFITDEEINKFFQDIELEEDSSEKYTTFSTTEMCKKKLVQNAKDRVATQNSLIKNNFLEWRELNITNNGSSTESDYLYDLYSKVEDIDKNTSEWDDEKGVSLTPPVYPKYALTNDPGDLPCGLVPETLYHFVPSAAPARIKMSGRNYNTTKYNFTEYISSRLATSKTVKKYKENVNDKLNLSETILLYDSLQHAMDAVERDSLESGTKYYPSKTLTFPYTNNECFGVIGAVGTYITKSKLVTIFNELIPFIAPFFGPAAVPAMVVSGINKIVSVINSKTTVADEIATGYYDHDSPAALLSQWYGQKFINSLYDKESTLITHGNGINIYYSKISASSTAKDEDNSSYMYAVTGSSKKDVDITDPEDIYIYRMAFIGGKFYAYGGVKCGYFKLTKPNDKRGLKNNMWHWLTDIKELLCRISIEQRFQRTKLGRAISRKLKVGLDTDGGTIATNYGVEYVPCTFVGWFPLDNIYTTNKNGKKPNISIYYLHNAYSTKEVTASEVTDKKDYVSPAYYYSDLYKRSVEANSNAQYLTNHSIIGLPFNFLPSTDVRYGDRGNIDEYRASYGSEYTNNILYDMSIAVITPGIPAARTYKSTDAKSMYEAIFASLKIDTVGETFKNWALTIAKQAFMKDYERFYLFNSAYSQYVLYVNTMCHLFATFLGIGDKDCPTAFSGSTLEADQKRYSEYDDTMGKMENLTDAFTNQFGTMPAVYIYYNPGTPLSQTFQTATTNPEGFEKVQSYATSMRNYKILADMTSATMSQLMGVVEDMAGTITGGGLLGQGIKFVAQGNNLSLPEIWEDSTTQSSFDIEISLVSPYGDPESIFLYILRPLARLLALILPRQTGANSYKEPFAVRAFSKGQFNCQIGYVTSLSIARGGNGGESHTVNHLPTELTVTMTIQDMYEKVMMSSEYYGNDSGNLLRQLISATFGTLESFGLLFNNIGYLDFIASYSGYNLNSASFEMQTELLLNILKNRLEDVVTIENGKLRFPQWERQIFDSYNDTFAKAQSFLSV